jgi:GT2 family glycosyltransferase
MKNYPKVFIVILNYNGKEVIKKCLASVFKIDYPNFEVVIIDNNSVDGSFEIARSTFSKASFIKNEENLGFSAGNNVGIRFAIERMAQYILILNNDTEVEKDFLKKLVEEGEKNKPSGILSPVIFNGDTKEVWFSGGKINWLQMKSRHETDIKKEENYETEYITGCAMLIKAEVFKKNGLFDENFFLYWEDADFSVRANRSGFKNIVVSSSWIYHTEESQKNNKNKTYWLVFSGLLFFKKNTPALLRWWIFIYIFFRKLKNKRNLLSKKGNKEVSKMVQQAYVDFDKARGGFLD